MADIGQKRQWLVDPSIEIKLKWVDCEIQSKKSQIVRLNQDIEDLKKGKLLELEAMVMMLERELKELDAKRINTKSAIDIKGE